MGGALQAIARSSPARGARMEGQGRGGRSGRKEERKEGRARAGVGVSGVRTELLYHQRIHRCFSFEFHCVRVMQLHRHSERRYLCSSLS